jgi:hypothetical protein
MRKGFEGYVEMFGFRNCADNTKPRYLYSLSKDYDSLLEKHRNSFLNFKTPKEKGRPRIHDLKPRTGGGGTVTNSDPAQP